jgi:uncharacterized membrane protein YdjX (TVP38/TMEM64 family)
MSKSTSTAVKSDWLPKAKRRAFVLLLLAAGLALVASSEPLHVWLIEILSWAEPIIRSKPLVGMSIFILFAAVSAMLAFVSSAIIVPVGVYVWGEATTILLLWIGWILGGICSYVISRYLGRPVVKAIGSGPTFERYENRISHQAPFALVLLFQVALPSELPGYLLGLVRYPFWRYLGALTLAELPYAVATIYFGASFIEGRVYRLAGLAIVMAVFIGWAIYKLHQWVPEERSRP